MIPETLNRKREKPDGNLEKKLENKDYDNSKISKSEINHNAQLEWRNKIVDRLNSLITLMTENPNDPANEKRKIESNTLIWVLQNMP